MNEDILFFFGEHLNVLPMYERLEELVFSRIPDVKIKVAKTQITFANKRGFLVYSGAEFEVELWHQAKSICNSF